MSEPAFTLAVDDDLPRTLRREREAREQQAREQIVVSMPSGRRAQRLCLRRPGRDRHGLRCAIRETGGVLSQGCLAGIPALFLLTSLLWLWGQGLQTFFPQLLKLKVLIYVSH